ncbi:MAG: serine/threonine protein kinase [Bacteroidetes bacterium]|nr:serine/threonine protein kinase [Bacteroidota bacterium]
MLTPNTVIQNYRLVRKLGEGGMGEVWLAEHLTIARKVAIKVLHAQYARNPKIQQRFRNEAATLSKLKHPNIVALYDFIESDSDIYLVMEYVEGRNLEEVVRTDTGPMPTAKLLQIFKQILSAVGYAHQQGVVHRDIKPSNFMIGDDGVVKVLDFGIAKLLEDDQHLTKTGLRMGTTFYMSPEQVNTEAVDHRSDIYSLGVTLFFLATGKAPYEGETSEYKVFDQIVRTPLPAGRTVYVGVAPEVDAVISKATKKAPADRFQGCGEFWEAVQETGSPTITTPRKRARVKFAVWTATIIIGVFVPLAILLSLDGKEREIGSNKLETIDQIISENQPPLHPERLRKMYDELYATGELTDQYDEWEQYYRQPWHRRKLYNGLKSAGYVTDSFDVFVGYYFDGKANDAIIKHAKDSWHQDRLRELYSELRIRGDIKKTEYAEWRQKYSLPENKRKLYDTLLKWGYIAQNYEEFVGYYFDEWQWKNDQISNEYKLPFHSSRLRELYDALFASGDVTVKFEEWRSYWEQRSHRKELYGLLVESGDVTVSFQEFQKYYFDTNPEDNLQELHRNLLKDGYELPSFEYLKDLMDDKKLKELHKNLSNDNYDLPDFATFKMTLSLIIRSINHGISKTESTH